MEYGNEAGPSSQFKNVFGLVGLTLRLEEAGPQTLIHF